MLSVQTGYLVMASFLGAAGVDWAMAAWTCPMGPIGLLIRCLYVQYLGV